MQREPLGRQERMVCNLGRRRAPFGQPRQHGVQEVDARGPQSPNHLRRPMLPPKRWRLLGPRRQRGQRWGFRGSQLAEDSPRVVKVAAPLCLETSAAATHLGQDQAQTPEVDRLVEHAAPEQHLWSTPPQLYTNAKHTGKRERSTPAAKRNDKFA